MVIITAAVVVLVMVSGSFALQVLERQQASYEFETTQRSILTFDDAVRDIAWDPGGSRSIRFTTNYGNMRLLSGEKSFQISTSKFSYTFTTAVIKYYMPSFYLTLGKEHSAYILGNESTVVSSLTDSFGQAIVNQEPGFATIALNYRVRVSQEGPSTKIGSTSVNYVDILVIRLNCINLNIGSGNFDLVAKNVGLNTTSYGPYSVGDASTISVASDGVPTKSIQLNLEAEQVMFNLIIADVQVTI